MGSYYMVKGLREEITRLREENEELRSRLAAETARADAMRSAHAKDALSLEQRLDAATKEAETAREAHKGQQRNTLAFMEERDEARSYGEQLFTCVNAEGDRPLPPPWLKKQAREEVE